MPTGAKSPAPPLSPRWLTFLILTLTALFFVACFSSEVADSDTWWHLKTGQYIVQNHRLPVPDPFAYGTYMGPLAYPGEQHTRYFNLTHEWLSQVFFYLVFAAGGFPGMVLVRALLLTAVCAAVGWLVFHRTSHFYLALAAAFLTLGVISDSPVLDRPLLLTLVLLVSVLAIVETRRRLWLLPLIFLIWGNLHSAFIVGWAVLGAYCADDLFHRWRRRPLSNSRTLWLAAAASILASGINPNGFRVLQILGFYQTSALQSQVVEWLPPALWPPEEMFTLVLYGAAALLLFARSKARLSDWLLYLFVAFAVSRASRNIAFLAVIGATVIASYFPWKRALPRAAEFFVAALILAGTGWQIAQGHAFEFHAADWKFPSGPATFLLEHHVTGRMFNLYGDGGYLMWRLWPMQQVLIDGRALNESVSRDAVAIAVDSAAVAGGKSSQQLLAQYGVDVIVLEGFEYFQGRIFGLAANLATQTSDEWKLVYRDPTGVVFMRHPPPGVAPLDPRTALDSFEDACEVHLEHDPTTPGCASGLSRLFAGLGDLRRTRKWAAVYLQHQAHPDPADVRALQELLKQ